MGWKIYFWLITAYLFSGYIVAMSILMINPPVFLLDVVVSLPAVLGLYALAYKKRYQSVRFWQIYSVAFIIYEFGFNFYVVGEAFGIQATVLQHLIAAIPFYPMEIGLLWYAYRVRSRLDDALVPVSTDKTA